MTNAEIDIYIKKTYLAYNYILRAYDKAVEGRDSTPINLIPLSNFIDLIEETNPAVAINEAKTQIEIIELLRGILTKELEPKEDVTKEPIEVENTDVKTIPAFVKPDGDALVAGTGNPTTDIDTLSNGELTLGLGARITQTQETVKSIDNVYTLDLKHDNKWSFVSMATLNGEIPVELLQLYDIQLTIKHSATVVDLKFIRKEDGVHMVNKELGIDIKESFTSDDFKTIQDIHQIKFHDKHFPEIVKAYHTPMGDYSFKLTAKRKYQMEDKIIDDLELDVKAFVRYIEPLKVKFKTDIFRMDVFNINGKLVEEKVTEFTPCPIDLNLEVTNVILNDLSYVSDVIITDLITGENVTYNEPYSNITLSDWVHDIEVDYKIADIEHELLVKYIDAGVDISRLILDLNTKNHIKLEVGKKLILANRSLAYINILPKKGYELKSILLNGVEVLENLYEGRLKLNMLHDQHVEIYTEKK